MTNFPTSLDSLPNPTGSDLMENATEALDHDVQHSNANDAIEALEAKVGINGSAVTTSHDYKLSAVTGSAKALTSGTSTQSVTGLTLVTPTLTLGSDATGDMYYRNGSSALTRLPIGTTGQILEAQASGIPAWVANPAATDASTTNAGVSQEATLAQVLARTAAGSDARLFVNPATLTTVQTYDYAADAGGTDAYAITVAPVPTAYVTGQVFRFKANTANTGTATLNVNSLGALTLKKPSASGYTTLETGDILANQLVEVMYNGTDLIVTSTLSSALSSSGLYYSQTIGTNLNGVTTAATAFNMFTSETDGSVLYSVLRAGNTSAFLERWAKDSTGAYYRTHSVSHSTPGGVNFTSNTARFGLAVVGSYLYLSYSHSSTTTVVFRFDKADLTNEAAITISGTSPAGTTDYKPMYTNGSDLIICSTTTTWYRYTISGTTITNAATVTTITGANVQGCIGDGSNVYFTDSSSVISKYSFTGTLSTSITRPTASSLFGSGETFGLIIGNSSVFYLLRGGIVESNTTQVGRAVNLTPIARF